MFKFFYLILSLILFTDCVTGFKTKKLLNATSKAAFYDLVVDELESEMGRTDLINGTISRPYEIDPDKLKNILGNIRFVKHTRVNKYEDYIFHDDELDTLAENLARALLNPPKTKKESIIVVISQFDHLQSVISNNKRTSFYAWAGQDGLNLVFGDIQYDVARDKARNFYDWTSVDPIPLTNRRDENEIRANKEVFKFKEIDGFENNKWLLFALDDLNKYSPRPKLGTKDKEGAN